MFERGKIPNEFSLSITVLIPKKGKRRDRVDSLRPISILNVLYRLLTKVLSRRINKVIECIVHSDQTGFIRGRYIGENVRLILDTIVQAKRRDYAGLILFCDWWKAYDSVDWKCLKQVIQQYGFGRHIRRWIDILYPTNYDSHVSARVQINGHLSREYKIRRGLRQGCSLSRALFLLAIEPLAHIIRNNRDIRGLTFQNTEIKVSAYADDFAIIMDGTERSLREFLNCCEHFKTLSGLTLNKQKTKAMWIGSNCHRNDIIYPEAGLSWDKGPVEYLGVRLDNTGENVGRLNYPEKIKSLKGKLNPWFGRSLTAYGRVYLVKSIALSQLIYLMTVIEKPTPDEIKSIESIVFKFIWYNKRDKVKRSVMKNVWSQGGFKVPDLGIQADSLKMKWVNKFLNEEISGNWKAVARSSLMITDSISIFECNVPWEEAYRHCQDVFWAETALAWANVAFSKRPSGGEILASVLWSNRELGLERNPTLDRISLMRKGVLRIKDLYSISSKSLLCSEELQNKYRYGNFLTWQSLLRSIPDKWRATLRRETPGICVENENLDKVKSSRKPSKWAYNRLLKDSRAISQPDRAKQKWERDLDERIAWSNSLISVYALTKDFKLRWLQYRLMQRTLTTNKMLFIYGVQENDECSRCPGITENLTHVFWHCRAVFLFWQDLHAQLSIPVTLSPKVVICGLASEDLPPALQISFQMCVLLAKQFIWISRAIPRRPTLRGFTEFVRKYVAVEKFIAVNEGKLMQFQSKWNEISDRLGIG